ncbi:hypothetical protein E2C01_051887 [Portunus trituberculatus]|uniref:Uncharacterized protein n=1 Tax=Portunus trituberculatus TaxID=210409 RepID=A0A5B7GKW6_PORTR|nr:hypothetical protein [Portunus trituberculatus]
MVMTVAYLRTASSSFWTLRLSFHHQSPTLVFPTTLPPCHPVTLASPFLFPHPHIHPGHTHPLLITTT